MATAARTFQLSDMVPNPLSFRDNGLGGDGTEYDVKTAELLSEHDVATMHRLQRKIGEAAVSDDDNGAIAALNQLFSLLIPGMPAERVAAMPYAAKAKFLEWWSAQHPKPTASAKVAVTPTRKVARKRRRG